MFESELWHRDLKSCLADKNQLNRFILRQYDVGYTNSEDRISEIDKLECYRLGWVRLVKV